MCNTKAELDDAMSKLQRLAATEPNNSIDRFHRQELLERYMACMEQALTVPAVILAMDESEAACRSRAYRYKAAFGRANKNVLKEAVIDYNPNLRSQKAPASEKKIGDYFPSIYGPDKKNRPSGDVGAFGFWAVIEQMSVVLKGPTKKAVAGVAGQKRQEEQSKLAKK